MDHVGIVVDDLAAARGFFSALGFEAGSGGRVGGDWVDRIIGVDGTDAEILMLDTPDGKSRVELVQFHEPAGPAPGEPEPSNVQGLRHLCFAVNDLDAALSALEPHGGELIGEVVDYGDAYRLCYLRGPAGIIVELAQPLS